MGLPSQRMMEELESHPKRGSGKVSSLYSLCMIIHSTRRGSRIFLRNTSSMPRTWWRSRTNSAKGSRSTSHSYNPTSSSSHFLPDLEHSLGWYLDNFHRFMPLSTDYGALSLSNTGRNKRLILQCNGVFVESPKSNGNDLLFNMRTL